LLRLNRKFRLRIYRLLKKLLNRIAILRQSLKILSEKEEAVRELHRNPV